MIDSTSPTWPERVTSTELAEIWKVTTARVSQLIRAGKITKDDDGRISLKAALDYRAQALTDEKINVLFQTYGNAHGRYAPKIFDHVDISDEEALGLPPLTSAPLPAAQAPMTDVMRVAMERQNRSAQLKEREAEMRIEAAQRRADKDAGLYILKSDANRACHDAAASVKTMLGMLEHDIPSIFADATTRSEVRKAIELLTDRSLYTIHEAFKSLGLKEGDR